MKRAQKKSIKQSKNAFFHARSGNGPLKLKRAQKKAIKQTKNAFFHARSGNGPLVTALIILSCSFVFLIFYYQTKRGFHEARPDILRPGPITFSPMRVPSSDRTNSDIRGNRENNNSSSPGNSFENIHLPPFWENDASAYFSTIELMFQEANMTSERSRYLALVTTLSRDASVFKSVTHLLKTTNAVTPFSTLKVAIFRLYSNAGGEDLETSLNDCVRGDDKVSNYLARLRSIFASRYCELTTLQKDILKSRVLQSVYTPTRLALYSYEQGTVDELAAHADRLLFLAKSQPATPMSKVNITSTKPQYKFNEHFDKQLGNMSDAVDELNRKLEKFTSYQRNKGSTLVRMNYVFTTTVMAIELINA